jgi:hypothetical protein
VNQRQGTPITDLTHNATTQQKIINSMKSHDFLCRWQPQKQAFGDQ